MAKRANFQQLRFGWDKEIKRLSTRGDAKSRADLAELVDFIKEHVDGIGVFEAQWVGVMNSAVLSGCAVEISPADALQLLREQGHRCALSGMPLVFNVGSRTPYKRGTAVFEKIDPMFGYTRDNMWWLHREISRMRVGIAPDRFRRLCAMVTAAGPSMPPPDVASVAEVERPRDLPRAATTMDAARLVRLFVSACCVEDRGHRERASALWDRFLAWCEEVGALPCSQTAFGRALAFLGYPRHLSHVVYRDGLRLAPDGADRPKTLAACARVPISAAKLPQ